MAITNTDLRAGTAFSDNHGKIEPRPATVSGLTANEAYADAREHVISAFLSIMASGFAEHVVLENYLQLRDYLNSRAVVPTEDGDQI